MITGLFHPGRSVSNLERSLAFYGGALGMEHSRWQVSDQPYLAQVTGYPGCSLKIGFVQIEGDESLLELVEHVHPRGEPVSPGLARPGSLHFAWLVDDLPLYLQRLASAGVSCPEGPARLDRGAWQGALGALVADPDGALTELVQLEETGQGSGRLVRYQHAGLVVADLPASLDLFCGQLGLELVSDVSGDLAYLARIAGLPNPHGRVVTLRLPGTETYLELIQWQTPLSPPADLATLNPGSGHLCFRVHDIHEAYQEFSRRGIRFVGPPAEVTAGVNRGAYAIYFFTTDGFRCEIFQRPPAS